MQKWKHVPSINMVGSKFDPHPLWESEKAIMAIMGMAIMAIMVFPPLLDQQP